MRKLVVDRYEGQYTVCEDSEQKYFAIDTGEMPSGTVPGSVIIINDDGTITLDEEETKQRRERILKKQNKLYNK